MKKLNNKGITIIEVIFCFVMISIITVSLYAIISSFNAKRIQEKVKEEIITYRNMLTKDMEDDFIKTGLTSATVSVSGPSNGTTVYTLNCTLKDGSKRRLIVSRTLNDTTDRAVVAGATANVNDSFSIRYGKVNQTGSGDENKDVVEYPLPDFGNVDNNDKTWKLLSINKVDIGVDDTSRVLRVYISLYHPEFGYRYSINIASPVNYNFINDKTTTLGLY